MPIASYQADPEQVGRVLLLYSGGLDTSVMLHWIQEQYGAEIVTLTVELGQPGENWDAVTAKAKDLGALETLVVDAREQFANEFVAAGHQGERPLRRRVSAVHGALARPLIARLAVEAAREHGCDTIAHGCTGKGNDQVRIDSTIATLGPELRVLAPVREWRMGREEEIAYAREHRIPVTGGTEKPPYSIDDNLWGRSSEGGAIEDLEQPPPDDVFNLVTRPEEAPDEAELVKIGFEAGRPVSLDGETLGLVELIDRVSERGCRHGVGIVDHLEDRIVGLKVRDLYEVPAATIILAAHEDLEKLVSTIHQNNFKVALDDHWAYLCYAGLWHEPLRERPRRLHGRRERVRHRRGHRQALQGLGHGRRPQLPLCALRQVAGRLRRVRRRVQPAGESRASSSCSRCRRGWRIGSAIGNGGNLEAMSSLYEIIGRLVVYAIRRRIRPAVPGRGGVALAGALLGGAVGAYLLASRDVEEADARGSRLLGRAAESPLDDRVGIRDPAVPRGAADRLAILAGDRQSGRVERASWETSGAGSGAGRCRGCRGYRRRRGRGRSPTSRCSRRCRRCAPAPGGGASIGSPKGSEGPGGSGLGKRVGHRRLLELVGDRVDRVLERPDHLLGVVADVRGMADQVVGQLRDQSDPLGGQPVGLTLGLGQMAPGLLLGIVADRLGGALGGVDDRLQLLGHLMHRRLDVRRRHVRRAGGPAHRCARACRFLRVVVAQSRLLSLVAAILERSRTGVAFAAAAGLDPEGDLAGLGEFDLDRAPDSRRPGRDAEVGVARDLGQPHARDRHRLGHRRVGGFDLRLLALDLDAQLRQPFEPRAHQGAIRLAGELAQLGGLALGLDQDVVGLVAARDQRSPDLLAERGWHARILGTRRA